MFNLSRTFFASVFMLASSLPAQAENYILIPDLRMSDLKMPTHPQDINCYIPKYETGGALDLHDQLEIVEITKNDGTTDHIFVCFEKAANGSSDIEGFKDSIRLNPSRTAYHPGSFAQ